MIYPRSSRKSESQELGMQGGGEAKGTKVLPTSKQVAWGIWLEDDYEIKDFIVLVECECYER